MSDIENGSLIFFDKESGSCFFKVGLRGVCVIFLFGLFALSFVACKKTDASSQEGNLSSTNKAEKEIEAEYPESFPLLIAPEDLIAVDKDFQQLNVSVVGTLQPTKRADLRAEIAAVVVQVLVENGDTVKRGDLLMRLGNTAVSENLISAESLTQAASRAYEQAERQYQRIRKLGESGTVSRQAVEDAEVALNSSRGDYENMKSHLAQARQQQKNTEIRAPIDGVVSDRKASIGDTIQIGRELAKIIDLRDMRFEGFVAAADIGLIKVGQDVAFRVHGNGESSFFGKVAHIDPMADATTRQVAVLVSFSNPSPKSMMAGLYVDGSIHVGRTRLAIPPSALIANGSTTMVWEIENQTLKKSIVVIGERDLATGEYELVSGVSENDKVLRYARADFKEGRKVELDKAKSIHP